VTNDLPSEDSQPESEDLLTSSDSRALILQAIFGVDTDEVMNLGQPPESDLAHDHKNFCDAKSLKDKSPFTHLFQCSIENVSLSDDDDLSDANGTLSPPCFQVIKYVIHLYPLSSSVFQRRVERFANDVAETTDDDPPKCLSNAPVEDHLKSVKHGF